MPEIPKNAKHTEAEDTGVISIRLGALRPTLESVCDRLGVERSDYVRQAIAEKMQWTGEVDSRALCSGAAYRFRHLINSAGRAGLVNGKLTQRLDDLVAEFQAEVDDQLDALYRKKFPESVMVDEEEQKLLSAWLSGGKKDRCRALMTLRMEGAAGATGFTPAVWIVFSDIERATSFVRRAAGEDVDYAPRGFSDHGEEQIGKPK